MTKNAEQSSTTDYATTDEKMTANGTASPDGEIEIVEGSPIIVGGGGSVNIHFREGAGHYVPVTGSPGVFSKAGDELDTVLVVDSTGVLTDNLLPHVNGKNCEVKIHTKIGSAAESPIMISSRPGGPLVLSFTAAEFGPHPTEPSRRPHFNRDRKLTDSIEVRDVPSGQVRTFPIPTEGNCVITILNSHG